MKLLNSLQLCANPHHGFCCLSSGTVTSDGAQHFNQRFVKPAWRAFAREIQLFTSSPPPQTVLINTNKLGLTPDSDKSRDIRKKADTAYKVIIWKGPFLLLTHLTGPAGYGATHERRGRKRKGELLPSAMRALASAHCSS